MKQKIGLDFILIAIIIAIYTEISHFFIKFGGIRLSIIYFELPITLLISAIFFFPLIHNRFFRLAIAIIPVTILYAIFDIFYHLLDQPVLMSDVSELPLLFDFYPAVSWSVAIILALFFIGYFCFIFKAHKALIRKEILRIISFKFSLLIIVMALFFSPLSEYYFKFMYEYVDWNQIKNIKKNGRIATVIFLNQKEALNKKKLSNYKNIKSQVNQNLFPGTVKYQKNIYYIVLESFFDPRRLEKVTYDPDPIHPDFSELLTLKTQFSTVISPIYGGGTAQAEFELLAGVPALSKIGSCEFNILKEKRTSGFLSKLVSGGYSATAIIASDSKYYNSRAAYTSLGFEKIVFLANEKSVNEEGKMIFDGDLLVYTYNHLAPDTPRFTYILGMYGHFPYERNKKKRPDVIKTSSNDERIVNISNQFYYRTKALADFVKKVQVDDPNSIIYITSDHLPPIVEKKNSFESIKYINDNVLFVNGRQVDVSENPLFKISWIIWDELTGEKIQRNCDLEDLYFQVLSESLL